MGELRQLGFGPGRFKVAIVGAGQLGTLLANRIPANCRKVVISQQKARAVQLADEVGGIASDQVSAVRGCRVVFLAVPGTAIVPVIQEVGPHLEDGALLVNMSADVMTDQLADTFPKIKFAAAKVIGHAREMALGNPGVVVLDHVAGDEEEMLRSLLEGLGHVTVDKESKVMAAHAAVVSVMVRAEAELRHLLEEVGLDRTLAQAAITTAGPGVLRSVSEGDIGPFIRGVMERLRAGEAGISGLSH